MNESLQERFPDMQPISGPPALTTVHGVGMSVYGRRDFDPETGTYVKTQVFCFLFFPLFALRAYRVADAPPQGWYFLGRVPLSTLAKAWNVFMLLVLAGGIGLGSWAYHTSRPEYKAARKLEQGDQLAAEGKLVEAANLYREVATGPTSHAQAAQEKLLALVDKAADANPETAAKLLRMAVEIHLGGRAINGLFERGLQAAKKHAEQNPRLALALLDAVEGMAPNPRELLAVRHSLAERFFAKHPDDPDALSEMAMVYEFRQEWDKAEKLLAPRAEQLGDREGARVLGMVYLQKNQLDAAQTLIQRYAEKRLPRLQEAERTFRTAQDRGALVLAQETMRREGRALVATLDLGIARLHHAQSQGDADARKKELEKAEQTFLGIASIAGQFDDFRLNLGEVYYWLGKHGEGRKQFDEHLQGQARSTKALLEVGRRLRMVGAVSEASALLEEAYNKESDQRVKHIAAFMRSLMSEEMDDVIVWLERSDLSSASTKASLGLARGRRALKHGQESEAAGHLREAIALYEAMPEGIGPLNDGAIAYHSLFYATGELASLDKSAAMMEKAYSLKQNDSILVFNLAMALYGKALSEIVSKQIDLAVMKREGNPELLAYLHHDEAGRNKLREQLRANPSQTQARGYFEKALVLAPKFARTYQHLAEIHHHNRDGEALRKLHKQVHETVLDTAEQNKLSLDTYQGKNEEKRRKEMTSGLAQHTERVKAARKVGGPTLAAAIGILNQARLADDTANPDELVALAEEADKAAPSVGTHDLLTAALLYRAHLTLKKQEPAYAALAKRCKHSLNTSYLIGVALFHAGPLQKACLANADVQRVQYLLREQLRIFPKTADEWSWAMLRAAYPDDAATIAKNSQADEITRLERAIMLKVSPLNPAFAFRVYWGLQIAGQPAAADAVLAALAAEGVPLPFDTKK